MPSAESSRASSGSRPRGQLAKNASEGLEDNQEHRGKKDEHRNLVEPAIPGVAMRVAVRREIAQQLAAPHVIDDEQRAERRLGVHPARAAEPAEPEPQAEDDG